MTWAENHLSKIPGIRSVTETLLSGKRTCHKCGETLESRCRSGTDRGRALVVRYALPEVPGDSRGVAPHVWSVLCLECKRGLATRATPYPLSTPRVRPRLY